MLDVPNFATEAIAEKIRMDIEQISTASMAILMS